MQDSLQAMGPASLPCRIGNVNDQLFPTSAPEWMVFSTVHRFGVPGGSDGRSDLGVQKHLYLTRHALPLLQRLEGIASAFDGLPNVVVDDRFPCTIPSRSMGRRAPTGVDRGGRNGTTVEWLGGS